MNKMLVGMIIICLDITINAGASVIDILPDFIGYLIMTAGLREMSEASQFFAKAKPVAIAMSVYTAILFIVDCFGLAANAEMISYILGAIALVVSLFLYYQIIQGVKDLEERLGRDLNYASLLTFWKVEAVCSILSYVLIFLSFLILIVAIIGIIAHVCFLFAFYKSKNQYYALQ